MTVRELVEKLQTLEQEMSVVVPGKVMQADGYSDVRQVHVIRQTPGDDEFDYFEPVAGDETAIDVVAIE